MIRDLNFAISLSVSLSNPTLGLKYLKPSTATNSVYFPRLFL